MFQNHHVRRFARSNHCSPFCAPLSHPWNLSMLDDLYSNTTDLRLRQHTTAASALQSCAKLFNTALTHLSRAAHD